jgi:hypothetical protein
MLHMAGAAELAASLSPWMAHVEAQHTLLAPQDAVCGLPACDRASRDSSADPWLHHRCNSDNAALLQDWDHPFGVVRALALAF